jgi:hypothetical protein
MLEPRPIAFLATRCLAHRRIASFTPHPQCLLQDDSGCVFCRHSAAGSWTRVERSSLTACPGCGAWATPEHTPEDPGGSAQGGRARGEWVPAGVGGNMLLEWYNIVFGQALVLPRPNFALACAEPACLVVHSRLGGFDRGCSKHQKGDGR